MKKLLAILVLGLLLYNNTILAFENSGPFFSQISHAYKISENKIIYVLNEQVDGIFEYNQKNNTIKEIARVSNFIALAKSCGDKKRLKNIYFATNKEYYFWGGFKENPDIRIFDLYNPEPWRGNELGIVESLDHAKNECEFYEPFENAIILSSIFNSLDLTSIKSSLAQRVKFHNYKTLKNFRTSDKEFKYAQLNFFDDHLVIKTKDWFYSIKILKKINDKKFLIEFFDRNDSNTYNSQTKYIIEKENFKAKIYNFDWSPKWYAIAQETILPKEEKTNGFVDIKNADRKIFYKFEEICIQNIPDINIIRKLANSKWTKLKKGQDKMIAPKDLGPGYGAWYFKDNQNVVFLIGINDYANTRTCSLASEYEDIENLKNFFKENYKYKMEKKYETDEKVQKSEFYELTTASYKGLLVFTYGTIPELKSFSASILFGN